MPKSAPLACLVLCDVLFEEGLDSLPGVLGGELVVVAALIVEERVL